MTNFNQFFSNLVAIAFVAGMLATGLALYSVGVSGLISWAAGAVAGVYSAAFVASTRVARTKGVMSK